MNLFKAKICGLTRESDVAVVKQIVAEQDDSNFDIAIGLNFYKSGKRYVNPDLVSKWHETLGDQHALPKLQLIGVFVNESREGIVRIADQFKLDGVQLHGDESHGIVPELRDSLKDETRIIRAVRTTNQSTTIAAAQKEIDAWVAVGIDAILLDAASPGAYGGTGKTLDWSSVEKLEIGVPLILAGGLKPENVAEAIQLASPHAVDVASGVETLPGEKNGELVKLFLGNARAAFEPK